MTLRAEDQDQIRCITDILEDVFPLTEFRVVKDVDIPMCHTNLNVLAERLFLRGLRRAE